MTDYQHSKPYTQQLPPLFPCGAPAPQRISLYVESAMEASTEFIEEWKRNGLPTVSRDFRSQLCPTNHGHLAALMFPESSPHRIKGITKVLDMILAADGKPMLPLS
ncbi:hypothetical protein XA68_16749 [Ophiocordyceps unilateralis]|uniref:Uncharacterized protein n=1 Tax=Ophiocordyceps unilateralis TaxID=268505 RepID=A0A2A9P4E4_OPHUN|nr:hypothetical protein XA68_16749 [Ophiocordyceps unilateralis]